MNRATLKQVYALTRKIKKTYQWEIFFPNLHLQLLGGPRLTIHTH